MLVSLCLIIQYLCVCVCVCERARVQHINSAAVHVITSYWDIVCVDGLASLQLIMCVCVCVHACVCVYVRVHQHIVNIEFLNEIVCGVLKFGI